MDEVLGAEDGHGKICARRGGIDVPGVQRVLPLIFWKVARVRLINAVKNMALSRFDMALRVQRCLEAEDIC